MHNFDDSSDSSYWPAEIRGNLIEDVGGTRSITCGVPMSAGVFRFSATTAPAFTLRISWLRFVSCTYTVLDFASGLVDFAHLHFDSFALEASQSAVALAGDNSVYDFYACSFKSLAKTLSATDSGAAIAGALGVTSDVHIAECRFEDNEAKLNGGAIALASLGQLSIADSHFVRNVAKDSAGGAIFVNPISLYLEGNEFYNNSATTLGNAIANVDET